MVTDVIEVKEIDATPVTQKVSHFLTEAKSMQVTDEDTYQYASELLMQEKAVYKFVEDFYRPTKDAMNLAKAELMKTIKTHLVPLGEAERIIKRKMGDWFSEQAKIRAEERRKIEEQLRKEEEERRLEEAIDTGDETVLDEPVFIPPVQVEEAPKVSGISYKDVWHGEVVEPAKVPREYLMPDEKKIDRVAKATKGTITIPGIKIWKEQIIAARSR